MATDSIQLSTNDGIGDKLSANTLSDGTKCQNIKLLSAADASETEIHAGAGVAANALRVELPTDGTGTVGLNAGTAKIGTVELVTGTADIGKVTSEGKVSHDASGTSIKPTLIGAIAYATDGTAPGTAVAETDLTRLKADRDGRVLVNTGHPFAWSENNNASAAATVVLKTAPGSSLSLYLTDIAISSLTAQTTEVVSDSGGSPVDRIPIIYTGANGNYVQHFDPPIRIAANTNLAYTTTAAVATSIIIGGYTAA